MPVRVLLRCLSCISTYFSSAKTSFFQRSFCNNLWVDVNRKSKHATITVFEVGSSSQAINRCFRIQSCQISRQSLSKISKPPLALTRFTLMFCVIFDPVQFSNITPQTSISVVSYSTLLNVYTIHLSTPMWYLIIAKDRMFLQLCTEITCCCFSLVQFL